MRQGGQRTSHSFISLAYASSRMSLSCLSSSSALFPDSVSRTSISTILPNLNIIIWSHCFSSSTPTHIKTHTNTQMSLRMSPSATVNINQQRIFALPLFWCKNTKEELQITSLWLVCVHVESKLCYPAWISPWTLPFMSLQSWMSLTCCWRVREYRSFCWLFSSCNCLMRSCSLLSSIWFSTNAGLRSDGTESLVTNSIW